MNSHTNVEGPSSSAFPSVGGISFDPYSKCIRFPPPLTTKSSSSADNDEEEAAAAVVGSTLLQGVIVEMSPGAEAFFAKIAHRSAGIGDGEKKRRPIITGEIIDIVDSSTSSHDDATLNNNSSQAVEQYQQTIRYLQSKHAYQTQQLLHKHSTTRHDLENTGAVERKHYLEIMRLMKRQQEEQAAEFHKAIIANQQLMQMKQVGQSSQGVIITGGPISSADGMDNVGYNDARDGPIISANVIAEEEESSPNNYNDITTRTSKEQLHHHHQAPTDEDVVINEEETSMEGSQQQIQQEELQLQDATFSTNVKKENNDDDDENANDYTDPTPRKTNIITTSSTEEYYYGENDGEVEKGDGSDEGRNSDKDNELSPAALSEAINSSSNNNNNADDDHKSNSSEEEEEGNVENSYRGSLMKSTDGTRDGSLRSIRSGRSGQSGKSAGGSEMDEGTRDGSLRSGRSGRSHRSNIESSNRSGQSIKSDNRSGFEEGTRDGSLRSIRSGRSGQSGKSAGGSETDEGTRDGSLRSVKSGLSHRSNIESSNRSGQSMKSDRSGTEEGTRDGSLRSIRSGRSSRSRGSARSETDERSRDGSAESGRSGRSGRSGGLDIDNFNRSGRSMQSNRSESVESRDGSVESARSSRSGRSGRSIGSDRSEMDGGSRDGSVESARSNRSEQSGRSRSSSHHDNRDASSHGGRNASDRFSVASEEDHANNDEESSHYSAEVEEAAVEEAPRKVVPAKPKSLPPRSGGAQRRKATKEEMTEIKDVMKDRSLSRTERLEKVQEIKARYAAAEEEGDDARMEEQQMATVDATVETTQVITDDPEQGSDMEIEREQSKEEKAEIKLVMKDKSLSKKDKKKKVKKIKAKYDAAEKKISKVKAAENAAVQATEDDPEQLGSDKEMEREVSKEEKAEIKLVMKDKDLSKKDKKKKVKKIKAKYDAAWKERIAAVKTVEAAAEDYDSDNDADEGQGQDDSDKEMEREPSKEERAEIKKITKDKNLSKKEKKKMIKRVKAKYDKKNTQAKRTDAKEGTAAKETTASQYVPQKSQRRKEGVQERSASPLPKEGERQDSIKANDLSLKSISPLPSNHTSSSNLLKDVMAPLESEELESEELQTDRTPMKKLVKMMEKNDPLLDVLKLDGRKKIKPEDWESFFQSLESNNSLTHLSISRCDLTDEIVVNLVLALVDNETLIALKLSSNKGLTDDTGKGFIKVLTQSNKTLKKLDLSKTKVSKKALDKISGIMEKRDDQKRIARMQDLRQSKILDLLSFSAGDNIAAERKMSELLAESDDEGNDASVRSGQSGLSGKSGRSGRRQSVRSAPGSNAGRGLGNMRGSLCASQIGGRGRGGAALRSSTTALRTSITARSMAQLGGDSLGADSKKLREQRKMKGECEDCGQRCFLKSMFKSTPLTIPNVVYEGRCLKCNPM
jgi:hypothetical protein